MSLKLKRNNWLLLGFLFVATCLMSVSLLGTVSARQLEISDVDAFELTRAGFKQGAIGDIYDGDPSTYIRSYGSANGFTSRIILEMVFNDPVDLLREIEYHRRIYNGGSSHGRGCFETVYVKQTGGAYQQVYYKDWSGISFTNIDTINVPGNWANVESIKIDIYATVGGHTSGNDLRLYEVDVDGIKYVDEDGDGETDETDCNDNDDTIWQFLQGYVDADRDGVGTGNLLSVCSGNTLPDGYADVDGDCDDTDDAKFQILSGFIDSDGDDYGAPGSFDICTGNTLPDPFAPVNDDCNDTDAAINPAATEVLDGIDNNCNGQIDEGLDGDGPQITIQSPQDSDTFFGLTYEVDFLFDVDDASTVDSCAVEISETATQQNWIEQNTNPISKTTTNSIKVNLNQGDYLFSISCSDEHGNTATTQQISFAIASGVMQLDLFIDQGYLPEVLYDNASANVRFKTHQINGGQTEDVPVAIYLDGALNSQIPTLPFAAGEGDWGIGLGILSVGQHNLTIVIDPTNQYIESDETNNLFEFLFTVHNSSQPPQPDTTPPASVGNLQIISVTNNSVTWGWTNPSDGDFDGTIIFINGVQATTLSNAENSYSAGNLQPNTDYTLTVHTVDTSGNVNDTDVSSTATTLAADDDDDDSKKKRKKSGASTKPSSYVEEYAGLPQTLVSKVVPATESGGNEEGVLSLSGVSESEEKSGYWKYILIIGLVLILILLLLILFANAR